MKTSKAIKRDPGNKQQSAKPKKKKKTARAGGCYSIRACETTRKKTICQLKGLRVPECYAQYICDHCKFLKLFLNNSYS